MSWSDTTTIADVSHWQVEDGATHSRLMDWGKALAAGLVGAIVKYSQGLSGVDVAAAGHIARAFDAGVPLHGGYHFGDGSDPLRQAAHFLDLARQHWDDLTGVMLMLDAEQNPAGQMSVRQAEEFVRAIHLAVGRWPWVYMGKSGPDGTGKGLPSAILSNCPLLLPAYGDHPDLRPSLPKGWRLPKDGADRGIPGWGVVRGWQFTDGTHHGGPFPGLGRVDQSRLIGFASLDEARAQWAS